MDCLAESIGIGWVWSKSIGICQKMGGSVKYTKIDQVFLFELVGLGKSYKLDHFTN